MNKIQISCTQCQLAKRYKTITRSSNFKITKLLSCSHHNSKTPKTCYSSQFETEGEKGR